MPVYSTQPPFFSIATKLEKPKEKPLLNSAIPHTWSTVTCVTVVTRPSRACLRAVHECEIFSYYVTSELVKPWYMTICTYTQYSTYT